MIDLQPVISHIQSLALFKFVGGAAKAANLISNKQAIGDGPNAFVIPMNDQAQPPKSMVPIQPVISTFAVLMMVKYAGDAKGDEAMLSLNTLQHALQSGLIGWTPDGILQPFYYAGGSLFDFQPGVVWWADEFSTVYGLTPSAQYDD